jgi:hypothetical protein
MCLPEPQQQSLLQPAITSVTSNAAMVGNAIKKRFM